jgi:hypothetical protein
MIWLGDCVNNTHYFAVDSASIGFAHIRIITDSSGEAEDMEFLYTNPAFNCLFGENPKSTFLKSRIMIKGFLNL